MNSTNCKNKNLILPRLSKQVEAIFFYPYKIFARVLLGSVVSCARDFPWHCFHKKVLGFFKNFSSLL
ncbi:hypothetical protein HMPREF1584_01318 [Gardnerella vaginalis JCP8481A]|uniref:Uncharacterized protein n=1 Tax=Gardnerella vaginalis TaxID=2702 RepID=A0A133NYS2_GARVA|nr:hypothetical protein HMPREF1584_01318 [Gardnerella vaginalis JCP8481A]KXA21446.1 hypothetical protein HMPREF3208_00540 [Gardnerella vaginalis]